jgi:hypothetical protein
VNLRPPLNLPNQLSVMTGGQGIHYEVSAEQAASLGYAGRQVEATLRRLKDFDAGKRRRESREDLLADAALAVQREIIGLRDEKAVIAHYAIPREVLSRLGQQIKSR